ncbi:Serine/threonine-protein kinase Nek5 [Basidiobolus ranarum]|uniref:non-specific serine/threonine protein kinase n=1 Tax=Basidiobolus ranarum TaxID=34480 RepID=A0ABR2W5X4_9FUNG
MSWFTQIALALSHIHNMNIIHRDVKTQNIFLTNMQKRIKVGDFGISRILKGAEKARTMIGTPYYMSPEVYQNKPYDQKTDVWALGCVLYELCSLRHPFVAKDIKALVVRISEDNYPPLPSQYSSDIRYLVSWMLSYDAEKRPNIRDILNTTYVKYHLNRLYNTSWFATTQKAFAQESKSDPPNPMLTVISKIPKNPNMSNSSLNKPKRIIYRNSTLTDTSINQPLQISIPSDLSNLSLQDALGSTRTRIPTSIKSGVSDASVYKDSQTEEFLGHLKLLRISEAVVESLNITPDDSIYTCVQTLKDYLEHVLGTSKVLQGYRYVIKSMMKFKTVNKAELRKKLGGHPMKLKTAELIILLVYSEEKAYHV